MQYSCIHYMPRHLFKWPSGDLPCPHPLPRIVAKHQLLVKLTGWERGDHQLDSGSEVTQWKTTIGFFGYAHTIIWYLNHIKLTTCKWKVCNTFLTTLSISATKTSKVTGIKSCFTHTFGVFSFSVLCLPSCKHEAW